MFLFSFIKSNLLIGNIPESLGLLILGVALIVLTIGLRWFTNEDEKKDNNEEKLENIVGKNSQ